MKAFQLKTLAAAMSLAAVFSSTVPAASALTVPEAITSIQSSNPTLPTGVTNPKGNIGFLLANMFWNSSDVGYDATKFGKIKPTYFDGAGATAWTYAGGNTYMTDMSGRVGIGTNDPQAYLHLKSHLADHSAALLVESPTSGSSSPRIALVDTSSGSVTSQPAWLLDNAFDRFRIFRQPNITNAGSVHFAISSSGNTAVGNSLSNFVPSATFEVRNTSANSNYAAWVEGGNVANYGLGVNIANSTSSKGVANFKSNNVSRLFVRADGNVGIWTISPESALDVNGDISAYTRFRYTSVNGDYFWLRSRIGSEPNALSIGIGSDETTGTTKDIRMLTNGVGRFYIAQDGKVGVWTLSPSTTLDVNGQIRIAWGSPGAGKILTSDAVGLATWTSPGAAYSESDPTVATTSSGYLARWNGAALVSGSVFDNGNVGIGIGTPAIKLAVWDSDTGLDWISDGKLDVYSNNVVAMAVRGHNVGFWTSAPNARVHSEAGGNLNNLTNAPNVSDIAGFFGYSATDGIGFDSNQIERIGTGPLNVNYNSTSNLILNYGLWVGGNVGIGIVNPTQKLEVAGVTTSTGFRALQGAPDNSDSSTLWYTFGADGDTGIFSPGSGSNNGQLGLYTNNTERMRIDSSGKVGIGTASPTARLEVVGSMILNSGGASDGPRLIWRWGTSGLQEYRARVSGNGSLSFFPVESGNAWYVGDVLVMTQSGNVGIAGASIPSASFEVKRTVADSNYAVWIEGADVGNYGLGVNIANTTNAKSIADFKSGNVSRMFVRADGYVGVWTTNPWHRFEVAWAWAGISIKGSGSSWNGMVIIQSDASSSVQRGSYIDSRNENNIAVANIGSDVNTDGSSTWSFSTTPAGIRTADRRVERMRIDSLGRVGIGTSTPDVSLNVVGNTHLSRDDANSCCAAAGDYTLSLAENTNSTGKMSSIQFHNSGVAEGYLRLSGSGARRFQMGDNQGVTMGLQMSGNLQVDWTGNSYVAGNVGIWTSTPGTKLEVAGQVKITGGSPGAGKVLTSDATGLATWTTPTAGAANSTRIVTANCTDTGGGECATFTASCNSSTEVLSWWGCKNSSITNVTTSAWSCWGVAQWVTGTAYAVCLAK